jgi:type IV pilus assembly protein PilX
MKAGRMNGRRIITPRSQRGVVLLIALIMLVAMTLAGIGMMRSVDTGSMIAGNMAFKQATLNASDAGTSAGFNALVAVANSNNPSDKAILNSNGNINLPGYSATPINPCEVTGQTNGNVFGTGCMATQNTWWMVAANWANAPTVTVADPTNGSTIATVSYLIHRMCQKSGDPQGVLCQTYSTPATGCSKTQLEPCTGTSVFYRITSRSVGLRNTVTYTQTLVLIGD